MSTSESPSAPSLARRIAVGLFVFCAKAGLALAVLLGLYSVYLDAVVTKAFEAHRWTLPARVYARPLDIYAGLPLAPDALLHELHDLGYRAVPLPAKPGEFSVSVASVSGRQVVRLVTRGFVFPDGVTRPQFATVEFSAARVEKLVAAGRALRLEPVYIGALRAQDTEDRVLMQLGERPPWLVESLFAIEDRDFPTHFGISPRGLLRALWVNAVAGSVEQGGSTLTQQLVKNLFLDSERTITRKLNEAIMAVLLEAHYDKKTILETYCNEIYLGQSGKRAVHGFALGSQFYFGRPVSELQLQEVALLVGLVKGPSQFNPWKHPERALERRNIVIDALFATGGIDAQIAASAKAMPLGVLAAPNLHMNRFPSFMSLVRHELQSTLPPELLRRDGLNIFTTMDVNTQLAAEAAIKQTLPIIETDKQLQGLEAALVVATPRTGEIEASVGGRNVDFAGFDRVGDARRTIGSLMKPVVFLTALRQPEKFSLASYVSDATLTVPADHGAAWRPANYDHMSHGVAPDFNVTLIDALAHSWNLATARLGMQLGVPAVIQQARTLGVTAPLPPYPAVLLGSATLSPQEVLAMYQPLAAGGLRIKPATLRGITDADGRVLWRRQRRASQVVDPATAFLLTHALQEVFRSGTAKPAYQVLSPQLNAAGKTGTTDNARDSWFAGYTGNHLAVAWVGYDDYRPTSLSGASGALRVWSDFIVRVPEVTLPTDAPADAPVGVEWASLARGGAAQMSESCPDAMHIPVIAGTVPAATVLCSRDGAAGGVRGFFRKLFGR